MVSELTVYLSGFDLFFFKFLSLVKDSFIFFQYLLLRELQGADSPEVLFCREFLLYSQSFLINVHTYHI